MHLKSKRECRKGAALATADVTIFGAGIFGLSIAWMCCKRGAKVQVIDPFGVAAGSSGGIVGALAPHVPENWNAKKQFQFESLIMAEPFWHEIAEASNHDPGYARLGRLQPIADEAALALAISRKEGAKQLWQGKAVWDVIPATTDGWAPDAIHLIRDTLTARIHPRKACHALAAAITHRGAKLQTEGRPEGYVIWANGVAGLSALNAGRSHVVGSGIKGQAALFDHDARNMPQIFVNGLHIVPHADGTTAAGSTSERFFEDSHTTDDLLEALIEKVRNTLPVLRNATVIEQWAGLRPRARSRAPMLGAWPDRPDHFIANGGFKIGFGMAPKVAETMADLVLEGKDTIPKGFEVSASL